MELNASVRQWVRRILIFPLIIACSILWAVVGWFFWLPTIIFAFLELQFGAFRSLRTGQDIEYEREQLEVAADYFLEGFRIILGELAKPAQQLSSSTKTPLSSRSGFWEDAIEISEPFVGKLLRVSVVWIAAITVFYFVNGSIQPLTIVPHFLGRLVHEVG